VTQSTILLVEADILVRTPLAQYLRECGYQVLEAIDATEARALFNAAEISIDVALIDASAHDEAAFELARWIRQSTPQVEVVLTGSVTKAVKEATDLCEDGPAITKPYNHQAVLSVIQRLLAARKRQTDAE